MAGADVRIRWTLDVVDRGGPAKALKQDRALRTSLAQTDRLYKKVGDGATSVSLKQVRAAQRAEAAITGIDTRTKSATTSTRNLTDAERQQVAIGQRVVRQSDAIAQAYRRQEVAASRTGIAARTAARTQEVAAKASKTSMLAAATAGRATSGGASRIAGYAAAGGLTLGLAAEAKTAVSFEKAMSTVQARLLATKKEMQGLNAFAIKLGADTQFSASEAAGAMNELASAGFTANQIYKVLPGTLDLAASSGTDLASSAEIQSAALRGFGLAAKDAGHVADVLAQTSNKSAVSMADLGETLPYVASTARQTGTSFEQVAAAVGILGNAGIKGSSAGTALRTSMLRLTDPTKKMVGELDRIGIGARDLSAIPLPEVIGKISKGIERTQNLSRGDKVGILSAVFGKEAAPSILNLMAEGSTKIDGLTKSLQDSDGAAKRSAAIMRDNVAGGWDAFTGSIESSVLTLTKDFMPAIQTALRGAGDLVDKGTAQIPGLKSGLTAGLKGQAPQGRTTIVRRGPNGVASKQVDDPTAAQKVGAAIGGVARTIGTSALTAGRQLLDAFKPALPFFQNVLLPLLEGIGKGILVSVVGAFKVVVPVIKVVATALGFIGTVAKPLAPIFRGVGLVLSFIFGGVILKGIALLGKLGGVFRLIGVAAKILLLPIRALGLVFRGVLGIFKSVPAIGGLVAKGMSKAGDAVGKLPGRLAGFAGRMLKAGARLVTAAVTGYIKLPAKLLVIAYSAGRSVVSGLTSFAGKVASAAGRMVGGIVRSVSGIPGKLLGLAKTIGGKVLGIGKAIGQGILDGIRSMAGAIKDAVVSIIPKPVRDVAGAVGGFVKGIVGGRSGGRLGSGAGGGTARFRRYRDGGLIDAMVSPGEMLVGPRGTAMIPGTPVAADNVHVQVPRGTAVLTGHGQSIYGATGSLDAALAMQMPHFAKGGIVKGKVSTFGPPDEPAGKTAYGRSSGQAGIAVNPRGGRNTWNDALARSYAGLVGRVSIKGHTANLPVIDKGPSIPGRMIDVTGAGAARLGFKQSAFPTDATGTVTFGKGTARVSTSTTKTTDDLRAIPARNARRSMSTLRAGVVPDAFGQAFDAARGAGTALRNVGTLLSDINKGTRVNVTTTTTTKAGRSASAAAGGATGDVTPRVAKMIAFARREVKAHPKYVYGGGHGLSGYDCSGLVSAVLRSGGFGAGTGTTDNLKTWGQSGVGKQITVGVRGSTGRSAHTMMKMGSTYFEAGGGGNGGSVGERKGWNGTFPINRHPKGYRDGGRVGRSRALRIAPPKVKARVAQAGAAAFVPGSPSFVGYGFRTGGTVTKAVRTAGAPYTRRSSSQAGFAFGAILSAGARDNTAVTDGLDALNVALGNTKRVTGAELTKLANQIDRTIRAAVSKKSPGGADITKAEALTIRRLRGARSLVDAQLGRRSGIAARSADRYGVRVTDSQTALDLSLRAGGVSADSTRGLAAAGGQLGRQQTLQVAQRAKLAQALKLAQRAGSAGKEQAAALKQELKDLDAGIADTIVQRIENARAQIAAAAQEKVDTAQFGADLGSALSSALDAGLRLTGQTDTPDGMRAKAAATSAQIPLLQAQQAAAQQQYLALTSIGDTAGARSALLAVVNSGTDIANAMADAADLVRQAGQKAAQDSVDAAAGRTTLAGLAQTRLELEQRISGTYDAGGTQRADFIRQQIVPALQGELAALQRQAADPSTAGDRALAQQIAEAIAGKQNDILQATLDATEAVADNTAPKKVGGTTGFNYGDETLTDSLILSGNGI